MIHIVTTVAVHYEAVVADYSNSSANIVGRSITDLQQVSNHFSLFRHELFLSPVVQHNIWSELPPSYIVANTLPLV